MAPLTIGLSLMARGEVSFLILGLARDSGLVVDDGGERGLAHYDLGVAVDYARRAYCMRHFIHDQEGHVCESVDPRPLGDSGSR